jgi:Subtilase family
MRLTAPGNDPYVITVGAMNTMGTPDRGDDVMTTYSSKGPTAIDHVAKPDLVAPGNRVISLQASKKATLVNNYPANRPLVAYYQGGNSGKLSDDYFILSGTSMAAPVVSAAAALLVQQDPAFTPDQIKARLMKTAHKSFPRYTTILDSGTVFNIQYDVFTVEQQQQAIVTGAVAFLTLQDSRPHVLFGTVLVKHLLDLISSFPQPVQFLRFGFGDAHRGRAIRIQTGGNQRVCNFQDVLKLFFKRPPSFCIHWRFSLSPIVKRRPTATSLGCPFFIAVRRFSAGARFVCRDTARSDRRPCSSIGWSTATISYAFRPLFAPATPFRPSFQVLGLQLRDVSLQTVVGWKPDRVHLS